MIIHLRPKRILFFIFLFFLTLELLLSIPPPIWYFYYERAKWDGKKWIPLPQPSELEVIVRYIRQGFK